MEATGNPTSIPILSLQFGKIDRVWRLGQYGIKCFFYTHFCHYKFISIFYEYSINDLGPPYVQILATPLYTSRPKLEPRRLCFP
jgi:hypothetical protein